MTYKEAQQIAHGLIQSYLGPDHRVIDIPSFFGALVLALVEVRRWKEGNLTDFNRRLAIAQKELDPMR
jgi:hypothetical protein